MIVLIIAVLIALSAYFSATETAFSSMNRARIMALAGEGNKNAALACALAGEYDRLLSTILIGNNIVNILSSSLGTILFIDLLKSPDLGATVSTVVITLVVLIFGEITPKSIAKDMPERFAMFSAPMLRVLMALLTPLTFFFSLWRRLLSRFIRTSGEAGISRGELELMVSQAQDAGGLCQQESDLLKSALRFSGRSAGDILTHRTALTAVPIDAANEQVARAFRESKFSRLPVYDGSIDNIVGVMHLKDFSAAAQDQPLSSIVTPAVYALESEKIHTLLRTMQTAKAHIAVVLDEFGGTSGIVSMEDIIEELVGEIWDEHEEADAPIRATGERTFRVDCAMDLDDFCAHFQLPAPVQSCALCSWIAQQLGRVPVPGDTLAFGPLHIAVAACENHRATAIDVTLRAPGA